MGTVDVGEGVVGVGGVVGVDVGEVVKDVASDVLRPGSVARRQRFLGARRTDLTCDLSSGGDEGSQRARGSGRSGERGSASSA